MNETDIRSVPLVCQDASVSSHACKPKKIERAPSSAAIGCDWRPGSQGATPALYGVLAVVEGLVGGDSSGGVLVPVECGAEGTEKIHDPEKTNES